MSTIHKVHPITITHLKGKTGRALVSAYGNVDWQGDRVVEGAFTKTIAEWEASGDKLPFIWSHAWADPFAHIGTVTKFTDTPRGLIVDFEIDTSTDFARQVAKLLGERRITKMSFAYDVLRETKGSDGANELLELKLIECGPCLSPANDETGLLSRKSVEMMLAREERGTGDKTMDSYVRWDAPGWHDRHFAWVQSEAEMKTKPRGHFTLDVPQRWVPDSDADLRAQLDALRTPRKAMEPGLVGVLTTGAAHLAQSAVAAQRAGLPTEEAALMEASRALRAIAAGDAGDVQDVIDACAPVVQALRTAGQPTSGDNLERTLVELSALAPKGRDANIRAKIEETWPHALAAEDAERERQRLIRVAEENSRWLPLS